MPGPSEGNRSGRVIFAARVARGAGVADDRLARDQAQPVTARARAAVPAMESRSPGTRRTVLVKGELDDVDPAARVRSDRSGCRPHVGLPGPAASRRCCSSMSRPGRSTPSCRSSEEGRRRAVAGAKRREKLIDACPDAEETCMRLPRRPGRTCRALLSRCTGQHLLRQSRPLRR